MKSDDDQFASRQVASSTLLRNTSLATPVPFQTEVFDMRPFASVSLFLDPGSGASTVYPCYATIQWWADQAMTLNVRTDKIRWLVATNIRAWNGTIPCRSDWMTITFDAAGAGLLGMIVIGQSRTPEAIAQQLPTGGGGLPPFALLFTGVDPVPGGSNGPAFYVPPWFGDVQVSSYVVGGAVGAVNGVFLDGLAGDPAVIDALYLPLNGNQPPLSYGPVGGAIWANIRFAMVGNQVRLRHGNLSGGPLNFVTTIQPVTGL